MMLWDLKCELGGYLEFFAVSSNQHDHFFSHAFLHLLDTFEIRFIPIISINYIRYRISIHSEQTTRKGPLLFPQAVWVTLETKERAISWEISM